MDIPAFSHKGVLRALRVSYYIVVQIAKVVFRLKLSSGAKLGSIAGLTFLDFRLPRSYAQRNNSILSSWFAYCYLVHFHTHIFQVDLCIEWDCAR